MLAVKADRIQLLDFYRPQAAATFDSQNVPRDFGQAALLNWYPAWTGAR
jgi:hypothetical protein